MSKEQDQSPAVVTAGTDSLAPPMYFPVSPVKLVVMSTCTLGIYELYWYYKNWCAIKERDEPEIMPFWRAFFAPLFCYSLFRKIQATAESQQIQGSIEPGPLALGWFVFTVLAKLPDPYWLASFLAVAFLLPVQATVNEVNRVASPRHDPNRTYTGWNVVAIAFGGLLLVLILVGTFLPSK